MAKKSAVEKNNKRKRIVAARGARRRGGLPGRGARDRGPARQEPPPPLRAGRLAVAHH